jgi:hypothetical protein
MRQGYLLRTAQGMTHIGLPCSHSRESYRSLPAPEQVLKDTSSIHQAKRLSPGLLSQRLLPLKCSALRAGNQCRGRRLQDRWREVAYAFVVSNVRGKGSGFTGSDCVGLDIETFSFFRALEKGRDVDEVLFRQVMGTFRTLSIASCDPRQASLV